MRAEIIVCLLCTGWALGCGDADKWADKWHAAKAHQCTEVQRLSEKIERQYAAAYKALDALAKGAGGSPGQTDERRAANENTPHASCDELKARIDGTHGEIRLLTARVDMLRQSYPGDAYKAGLPKFQDAAWGMLHSVGLHCRQGRFEQQKSLLKDGEAKLKSDFAAATKVCATSRTQPPK